MAITELTQRRVDVATVRVEWASDLAEPTFYLYVNGEFVEETQRTYALIEAREPTQFEVFDDPEAEPAPYYPGRFTIGWDAVAGAESYEVQERVDGDWVTRAVVRDTGDAYYTWRSRVLPDGLEAEFRVRARTAGGNVGDAAEAAGLMVRTPSPPDLDLVWDEGEGELVVSAG